MLKAYKYYLLPTEEQKQQLAKFFGSCRFVYNLGLECKMQAWASARKHLTCIDLANQMKELKAEAEWLQECRFQPSSKSCSYCGYIFKELSLKDRSWTCQSCGTTHDRDCNAANNIKNFGLRIKPSTVNVSH